MYLLNAGWSNNSNDTQQITRRKSLFNMCAWGIHISTKIPDIEGK